MAASSKGPVKPCFYRMELDKDTWTVPDRYKDFVPIGIGGFSTVWLVTVFIIMLNVNSPVLVCIPSIQE